MLYRFIIELSDIDRGVYEILDFRLSQHPSEIPSYLLTKALAYALSYQEGLTFSAGGLSDPEAPAIQLSGKYNAIDLWIEIGNPSPRKLHKATKVAQQVTIYTYKNAEVLVADIRANDVHKASDLHIFSFSEKFIAALEENLEKNNRWSLLVQNHEISLSINNDSFVTEIKKHSV